MPIVYGDNVTQQLQVWQGEFGRAYTDRNPVDWRTRFPAFQRMLEGLPITSVLEVGCNRGHNLRAVAELLGEHREIVGIEPNTYARQLARATYPEAGILSGHAFDLPFKDAYFDLVFTAGVLIHIPLDDLPLALAEIHRVSRRYMLAVEYFAEEETVIHYRGYDDLLWKRDFRKHYQTQWPDLRVMRCGYWERQHGFERTHWWLFEKPMAGRGTQSEGR